MWCNFIATRETHRAETDQLDRRSAGNLAGAAAAMVIRVHPQPRLGSTRLVQRGGDRLRGCAQMLHGPGVHSLSSSASAVETLRGCRLTTYPRRMLVVTR